MRKFLIAAALALVGSSCVAAPEDVSIKGESSPMMVLPAVQMSLESAWSASATGEGRLPGLDVPPQPLVPLPDAAVSAIAGSKTMPVADAAPLPVATAEKPAQAKSLAKSSKRAAADLKSAAAIARSSRRDGAYVEGLYDGSAPADSSVAADEPKTADALELYFGRHGKKSLESSAIFSSVHLMDTPGRKWHWERFRRGAKIGVHSGSQTLFISKVERGITKIIGRLTKNDLEGVYSRDFLRRNDIRRIRQRMIEDLSARNSYKPVGLHSPVRLVRFMPMGRSKRELSENKGEEPFGDRIIERRAYEIPEALARTSKTLPKAVFLDLRLFPQGIPPEIVEDMNKLMNAGVYFVLATPGPISGSGSVEDILTRRLSPGQKDKFHRYKMLALADDGNTAAYYDGNFPKLMPMPRFDRNQIDIMRYAAGQEGVFGLKIARGDAVAMDIPAGQNVKKFSSRYAQTLARLGIASQNYHMIIAQSSRGSVLALRPLDLGSAVPKLLSLMRDHQQLYVNNGDLMVISRDPVLISATPGAAHPAQMAPNLKDDEAADMALASLLPDYRTNQMGDLAASASSISSFLQKRDKNGGRRETVEMFLGHVMHSAFNWALWRYREDGVFPDEDAIVAQARRIWDESIRNEAKMLSLPAGETMSAYYEDIDRLRPMHRAVAAVLKDYPIVLGTELPNIFITPRYKGSQPLYRDIFRLVYDFAAARQTPQGMEILIVDFKTGKTPTNQKIDKDIQPQLYEWVARQAWDKISAAYGSPENLKPVSGISVRFIYPTGAKDPSFNEWGRMRFEKSMKSVMKRIRRDRNVALPGAKKIIKAKT
ncbi:MAG: PD-(D/E)XK nuclease family protein [Elusimicrobiota bacterium]